MRAKAPVPIREASTAGAAGGLGGAAGPGEAGAAGRSEERAWDREPAGEALLPAACCLLPAAGPEGEAAASRQRWTPPCATDTSVEDCQQRGFQRARAPQRALGGLRVRQGRREGRRLEPKPPLAALEREGLSKMRGPCYPATLLPCYRLEPKPSLTALEREGLSKMRISSTKWMPSSRE